MIFVIDASVGVKWFFSDEHNHAQSLKVLNMLVLNSAKYVVPDLFFIEVSSVLSRKSSRDYQFCLKALRTIYGFGIKAVPSNGELLEQALHTASKLKLSVYDGIYLSVAENLKGKWITSDKEAIKTISKDKKLIAHVLDIDTI